MACCFAGLTRQPPPSLPRPPRSRQGSTRPTIPPPPPARRPTTRPSIPRPRPAPRSSRRWCPLGAPRRETYEGVMPGFTRVMQLDEQFGPWIEQLRAKGYAVPEPPAPHKDAFLPLRRGPQDDGAGPSFAPARYRAEDSETSFLTDAALAYIAARSDEPWCVHLSYYRPHPPHIAPAPDP